MQVCGASEMHACSSVDSDCTLHTGPVWSRMLEYGIVVICIISALIFSVLMVVSVALGGDPILMSGSAVAEYIVFVAFVAISLYGMSLMTYISNWYSPVKDGERIVWSRIVRRPDASLP